MESTTIDLTSLLGLRRDRYAKNVGHFLLTKGACEGIGNGLEVWDWMRNLGGLQLRIAYLCENLKRRDIIGRQGVHNSRQDGKVKGDGHAMASREGLTLSFWTCIFDSEGNELTGEALRIYQDEHPDKCNTGTGLGYRTIRSDRILAVRIEQGDSIMSQHISDTGYEIIALARSL